jgi:hypothetical protein
LTPGFVPAVDSRGNICTTEVGNAKRLQKLWGEGRVRGAETHPR